jgi:uracil phosphoribosyltransferase/phosphoglycolate phosphatase-like HAD superfamily hydrolase
MSEQSALPKVTELVKFFLHRQQDSDEQEMDELVDRIVISRTTHPVSALVFDADKTLSAADSGHLFWEHIQHGETAEQKMDYLATIFSGPLGYTNAAFLQAALLYEELEIQKAFDCVSGKVAAQISLYPEVAALLIKLHSNDRLIAIVVTCGLRSVWVEVLRRHGLFDRIKVIGSGPLSNAPVITAQVKARVVARLQNHHHLHVVAVGDSVLDIDMFAQADRAIVVVGDERSRSRSMERELGRAIFEGRFAAHQAVLARGSSPRLTTSILPLVDLNGPAFWNGLLPNDSDALLNIIHFTDAHVSGILATPMRDAANSGPALRDAHWQTGRYLALQTLPDLLGVEEYMIQHVQGHQVAGTRIAYQDKTLIIALMRGGEPMAFGVSDVLPASPFLHARRPEDVKPEHVDAMNTVILVDSVVNSGKSIVDFICHLEALSTAVRIVIIAGVVQNGAIGTLGALQKAIHRQKIDLIALRFSNNKFTGRGGTDTGNRLYQTTRLA